MKKYLVKFNYKNILHDLYIPQGFLITNSYYILSAYKKNNYSRLYFYNKKYKFLGYCILNIKAHVGGVSIKSNNLFVTSKKGEVLIYDFNDIINNIIKKKFINKKNNYNIKEIDKFCIRDNYYKKVNASSVYYYNNHIYVSTFSRKSKIFIYTYYNNELRFSKIINAMACVQGLCLKNINNQLYLFTSHSYGKNKSIINKYILKDKLIFQGQIVLDYRYLEGIDLYDNYIYGIFEKMNIKYMLKININLINNKKNEELLDKYKEVGLKYDSKVV